jgi:hypothetical protein
MKQVFISSPIIVEKQGLPRYILKSPQTGLDIIDHGNANVIYNGRGGAGG